MREFTIEITDYCPHSCPHCSSMAGPDKSTFLSLDDIKQLIPPGTWDRINISGGEPLAHPDFWKILQWAKTRVTKRTGLVSVYTNAIEAIRYNAGVIQGVRVEANLPVLPGTSEVHVLKMIPQGYEAQRPAVHMSRNWAGSGQQCKDCDHKVLRPDGRIVERPCQKDKPSSR